MKKVEVYKLISKGLALVAIGIESNIDSYTDKGYIVVITAHTNEGSLLSLNQQRLTKEES